MTQYIEDFLPPIQDAGLNTLENVSIGGTLTSTGVINAASNVNVVGTFAAEALTAVPATAGAIAAGKPITIFSNGPTIYVTSDVPTHVAVKGSICINTGGTTTNNRMYVNTDGAGTWTSFTTAA